MGRITAGRATSVFGMSLIDCLLAGEAGGDQVEYTPRYEAGIEASISPPSDIAAEDIFPDELPALSEALSKTKCHAERSSNPVARCESKENSSHPISPIDAYILI